MLTQSITVVLRHSRVEQSQSRGSLARRSTQAVLEVAQTVAGRQSVQAWTDTVMMHVGSTSSNTRVKPPSLRL